MLSVDFMFIGQEFNICFSSFHFFDKLFLSVYCVSGVISLLRGLSSPYPGLMGAGLDLEKYSLSEGCPGVGSDPFFAVV